MRSNGFILLFGILFILLIDLGLYTRIRHFLSRHKGRLFYWLHSLLFVAGLFCYYFYVPRLKGPETYYWISLGIGILFLFYIPKFIFILISLLCLPFERIRPSSSRRIRWTAAVISGLFFIVILYSITYNRYNYKTGSTSVCFPQLPPAFENFKIVQLSDIHLGSHSVNYRGIPLLVDRVNRLAPDVILFTGDMVNNFATELRPWIKELSRLKARYGKFAVTGNHDYGLYTHWQDTTERLRNMEEFYDNMEKAGFVMLNNTSVPIVREQDTLYIAGVENWGNPPFPRYGKLEEALKNCGGHFVVLLSHDPSHWEAEVLSHGIPLTLSGHTHAMQMGIKIGDWEWSPSRMMYPQYDGLYRQGSQYLHVSRGEGYIGFPGRIGLRPQLDEIILQRNCNDSQEKQTIQ